MFVLCCGGWWWSGSARVWFAGGLGGWFVTLLLYDVLWLVGYRDVCGGVVAFGCGCIILLLLTLINWLWRVWLVGSV